MVHSQPGLFFVSVWPSSLGYDSVASVHPVKERVSMPNLASFVQAALSERFGEQLTIDMSLSGLDELARIAAHRVHRRYLARENYAGPVAIALCLRPVSAIEKRSSA